MAKIKATDDKLKVKAESLDRLEEALTKDPEIGRAWGTDPAAVLAKFGLVEDSSQVKVKFSRFERRRIELNNNGRFGDMLTSAWCGCGHLCSPLLEGDVEFESS